MLTKMKTTMKSKLSAMTILCFTILSTTVLFGLTFSFNSLQSGIPIENYTYKVNHITSDYDDYLEGNLYDYVCSSYILSVYLSESTSTVAGNLTVDYYNDDLVNYSQIPFHLYPWDRPFP